MKTFNDFFPKPAKKVPDKQREPRYNPIAERKRGDRIYTDRFKNFNPRFDTPDLTKRFKAGKGNKANNKQNSLISK